MPRRRALAALIAALCSAPAFAQTTGPAKLSVGDAAPPLVAGTWLKGAPVTKFEPGKLYVVEFWATWCGPCREAIPHLTELAKKHADVTFVGQDVFEEDDAAAKPFVAQMGEKMDYHIAADDKTKEADGAMAATWLKAAGIDTIPTTFIVGKDGKIAWIGHPMAMEPVLDGLIAGTFDAKAAAEHDRQIKDAEDRVNKAVAAKDVDGALKAADALATLNPAMADAVSAFEFNLLAKNGRTDDARARAERIVADGKNPGTLNDVAWTLVAQPAPTAADLKIARTAIDRACQITAQKDPALLDTSARVYAAGQLWDKAVEQQQKAVALADGDVKSAMQKTLDTYQKYELPAVNEDAR